MRSDAGDEFVGSFDLSLRLSLSRCPSLRQSLSHKSGYRKLLIAPDKLIYSG